MNTPQTYYTLEMIRQQRSDKKAEILQSKQRMYQLAHQLFNPPQSKTSSKG